MRDEAYKPDSPDELSSELRAAVERLKRQPIPEAAMQRALERAAGCGLPVGQTEYRVRLKAVLAVAAVVAVGIALGFWLLRPADLWADVVKAVRAKPWIHGDRRGAEPGQSAEFWISTSRGSGGFRSQEQISFIDDRLQVMYRYQPQKKVLYRLPASSVELIQNQEFLEIFQGLFRGDAELKAGFSGLVLKEQKRRQREKDGRKWDEYELVFRIPSHDGELRMTFVVDAQTRLPVSMTMKDSGGESVNWAFNYPENGPADIYSLGVPKDAKLVDRVPTGDMSRILAAIQAGRDRFDDFHAMVVRAGTPDLSPGPGQPIPMAYLVWRKGKRWRVEVGVAGPLAYDRAGANKDKRERVREAFKSTVFDGLSVCDGQAAYRGDLSSEARQRGRFKLVATAAQADWSCQDAMHAMPASWSYPLTFNPPNDRTEETVNLKPSEGPPNTILVTSRLVDWRGRDPANTFSCERFWLDPMRGYAVVREDVLFADPAVKPPTDRDQHNLMDQWEQTPSGIWYPTRVGTGPLLKGLKTGATWYHFFLDFQADMPDELFKPAKRTVLTDRYPVGS
jgi:hypothetical protein